MINAINIFKGSAIRIKRFYYGPGNAIESCRMATPAGSWAVVQYPGREDVIRFEFGSAQLCVLMASANLAHLHMPFRLEGWTNTPRKNKRTREAEVGW